MPSSYAQKILKLIQSRGSIMLILVDNFSTRRYANEELFNFMPPEIAKELDELDAYVVVEEDDYLTHATVYDYDVGGNDAVVVSVDVKENLPMSSLIKKALDKFRNNWAVNIKDKNAVEDVESFKMRGYSLQAL